MRYVPEPLSYDNSLLTTKDLAEYLSRALSGISYAIDDIVEGSNEVFTQAPTKPRTGMLRYADGTAWDPGNGVGMYLYNGTSWLKVGYPDTNFFMSIVATGKARITFDALDYLQYVRGTNQWEFYVANALVGYISGSGIAFSGIPITANYFSSSVATGTAPIFVASTTVCSSLNADMVDGYHAASFLLASSYTASDVLAKLLTVDGNGSTLDADTVDGSHASAFAASSHNHAAGDINSGTIATARLGSGSASSSTWLRGDQSWASITASDIISGTLNTARLGSGSADSGKFLRGDGAWALISQAQVETALNSDSTVDLSSVGVFTLGTNSRIEAASGTLYSYSIRDSTTSATANMYIDGTNGFMQRVTSSLKYKRDVLDAKYGIKDVMKLRPVTFKSKKGSLDGEKRFAGFIAEEVHAAGLTEFVQYINGEPDSLHYDRLVALAVGAIQELNQEVEKLKAKA